MAARAYVLCRRDLSDFGEAPRFCAKPIVKANALNWCPDCRASLPLWASDVEVPAAPGFADHAEEHARCMIHLAHSCRFCGATAQAAP